MAIENEKSEYRWETPYQEACAHGIHYGYGEVDRLYGPANSESLSYHELGHTAGVADRTVRILSAIRAVDQSLVNSDDIFFGALMASHHDLIQAFVYKGEGLSRVRIPDYMNIEARSHELLEQYMRQHKGIFSEADINFAGRALFATVCNRDSSGKITQPYIEHSMWSTMESGRSVFIIPALAMADLGDAGMSPHIIDRGNAMFRENHEGITTALATRNINTFSLPEKRFIRERMINWAGGQIAFVQGRRNTFEEQCNSYFPQELQGAVRTLFPYFDFSEQKVSERYTRFMGGARLPAMVQSMGYR